MSPNTEGRKKLSDRWKKKRVKDLLTRKDKKKKWRRSEKSSNERRNNERVLMQSRVGQRAEEIKTDQ